MYKITNKINGKYYIGVHATNDIDDEYFGSGKALKRAIKKYGKENFEKEILKFYNSSDEMFEDESRVVNEKLVKKSKCYNEVVGGLGGMKNMIAVKDVNNNYFKVFSNDPRYLSGELVGVCKNRIAVKDVDGNTFSVDKNDPRYLSGELVGVCKGTVNIKFNGKIIRVSVDDPRANKSNHLLTNKVSVKDADGNTFSIDKNDPRYLSGELIHISRNRVTVKDVNGNTFSVDKNDPRYLSGELVGVSKNFICINNGAINKQIPETELQEWIEKGWKRGMIKKKKYSMKEMYWVNNGQINKPIHETELQEWIEKGWKRGMIKKR